MTDTTPTPLSSPPHKATPKQWYRVSVWGNLQADGATYDMSSTICELRARVEALEAQQAQPSQPAAPADDAESGLVWQVAYAIFNSLGPGDGTTIAAESAIRAVARWLRAELHGLAADRLELELYRLEQEAGR